MDRLESTAATRSALRPLMSSTSTVLPQGSCPISLRNLFFYSFLESASLW